LKLSDGSYLVEGKTVTGFANVEEDYSDSFVGETVMPFRVEDALKERGANYIQGGLFKAFAVRDGRLITGQQQYSGRAVAQVVTGRLGGGAGGAGDRGAARGGARRPPGGAAA